MMMLYPAAPRMAVLIPAYNAHGSIETALASLADNTEPHDVIVVDDGSTPPLAAMVAPRSNLRILRLERNAGITGALNRGLHHILDHDYEFVARLDADDVSASDRLAVQRAFLDAHPDIVAVGSWGEVVSEQGAPVFYLNHPTEHKLDFGHLHKSARKIKRLAESWISGQPVDVIGFLLPNGQSRDKEIRRKLYHNNSFLHSSLMFRTEIFRESGMYREGYPSAEDYELMVRLASRYRLANLPQYLIPYTLTGSGISLGKRRQQLRSRLKVQWNYRNFGAADFYLGLLRTLILRFIAVRFIMSIKRRHRGYRRLRADAVSAAVHAGMAHGQNSTPTPALDG
jgi:glycosyltransferase involved in cell wall biosynthesis